MLCWGPGRLAHHLWGAGVLLRKFGPDVLCGPPTRYISTVPNRDGRASDTSQWTIHSQRTQNGPEVAEEEGQVMSKPGTSDLPHHLLLKSLSTSSRSASLIRLERCSAAGNDGSLTPQQPHASPALSA